MRERERLAAYGVYFGIKCIGQRTPADRWDAGMNGGWHLSSCRGHAGRVSSYGVVMVAESAVTKLLWNSRWFVALDRKLRLIG